MFLSGVCVCVCVWLSTSVCLSGIVPLVFHLSEQVLWHSPCAPHSLLSPVSPVELDQHQTA